VVGEGRAGGLEPPLSGFDCEPAFDWHAPHVGGKFEPEGTESWPVVAQPGIKNATAPQPSQSAGEEKARASRFACVRSIDSPTARNVLMQRTRCGGFSGEG
jgi:hypothetical protein